VDESWHTASDGRHPQAERLPACAVGPQPSTNPKGPSQRTSPLPRNPELPLQFQKVAPQFLGHSQIAAVLGNFSKNFNHDRRNHHPLPPAHRRASRPPQPVLFSLASTAAFSFLIPVSVAPASVDFANIGRASILSLSLLIPSVKQQLPSPSFPPTVQPTLPRIAHRLDLRDGICEFSFFPVPSSAFARPLLGRYLSAPLFLHRFHQTIAITMPSELSADESARFYRPWRLTQDQQPRQNPYNQGYGLPNGAAPHQAGPVPGATPLLPNQGRVIQSGPIRVLCIADVRGANTWPPPSCLPSVC
jgi:hypothetical protein